MKSCRRYSCFCGGIYACEAAAASSTSIGRTVCACTPPLCLPCENVTIWMHGVINAWEVTTRRLPAHCKVQGYRHTHKATSLHQFLSSRSPEPTQEYRPLRSTPRVRAHSARLPVGRGGRSLVHPQCSVFARRGPRLHRSRLPRRVR